MQKFASNSQYNWKNTIFHDGGTLFVSPPNPKMGEKFQIRIQFLKGSPITKVFLSLFRDGEELNYEMQPDFDSKSYLEKDRSNLVIYSIKHEYNGKQMHYRFRILTENGHFFYSTLGLTRITPPDEFNFQLIFNASIPKWLHQAVFYQIFPDRFYNGNPQLDVKNGEIKRDSEKSVKRNWEEIPGEYGKNYTSLHFYGGDLTGIRKKIPYLKELGVNTLYLNPIFTASTNHRYNTENYFEIDPHLGSNHEFAELVEELHKEGIRIILDAVINHTGDTHPWFNRHGKKEEGGAFQSRSDPYFEFFRFYNNDPESYDAWKNFKLLPRLNYNSDALKSKIYRDPDSILQFWMKPPYNIDGWRFDCANMIGKYDDVDLSASIWQEIHLNLKKINPDSLLLGETFYDGTDLISPEKLDAVTNYAAFYSPLVRWLTHQDGFQAFAHHGFLNFSFNYHFSLEDFIKQAQLFRGKIPFQYQLIQLNLLDSHDVPRMFSIIKQDEDMMKMAVCMLFTYPGLPLIYYGDEIGLEGINDPANRRPMIWDESKWNKRLRSFYKQMIKIRKEMAEFQTGSFFLFEMQSIDSNYEVLSYARFSEKKCFIVILQKFCPEDSNADGKDSITANKESIIEIPLWQLGFESGHVKKILEREKNGDTDRFSFSHGVLRVESSEIFPYFIGEVH